LGHHFHRHESYLISNRRLRTATAGNPKISLSGLGACGFYRQSEKSRRYLRSFRLIASGDKFGSRKFFGWMAARPVYPDSCRLDAPPKHQRTPDVRRGPQFWIGSEFET
jgi:hypothetical protein